MGVASGDCGVGAGDADGGNACVLEGVRSGDGDAGAIGAQDHGDALGDQLAGCADGLVVGAFVVNDLQLDVVSLAADLDGGSDGVSVLDAQDLLLAACAVVAGLRLEDADLDGIAAGCCGAACCGTVVLGAATSGQAQCHAQCQHECC